MKVLFILGIFVTAIILLILFPASIFLKEVRNEAGMILLKWLFYAVVAIVAVMWITGVFSDHEGDLQPVDKTCNSLYNDPCEEEEGDQYEGEEPAPDWIPPEEK